MNGQTSDFQEPSERDWEIFAAVKIDCRRQVDVAAEFGLCQARVSQIVQAGRRRIMRSPETASRKSRRRGGEGEWGSDDAVDPAAGNPAAVNLAAGTTEATDTTDNISGPPLHDRHIEECWPQDVKDYVLRGYKLASQAATAAEGDETDAEKSADISPPAGSACRSEPDPRRDFHPLAESEGVGSLWPQESCPEEAPQPAKDSRPSRPPDVERPSAVASGSRLNERCVPGGRAGTIERCTRSSHAWDDSQLPPGACL